MTTDDPRNKSSEQIGLGPNILLPLATSLSYALCYAFYCGYYNYFGLPFSLIEIRLTDLLLLFLSSTFLLQITSLAVLSLDKNFAKRSPWLMFCGLVSLLFCQGRLLNWNIHAWLSQYFYLMIIWIFGFIIPFPFTIRNWRIEKIPRSRETFWESLCAAFSPASAHFMMLGFLVCLFMIPFAIRMGEFAARQGDTYPLYDSGSGTCAVVSVLQDRFICVDFTPKSKTILKQFSVIPLSAAIKFRTEKIGPLN